MYVLQDEFKVWWPVVIPVPSDHGKTQKHEIELQFVVENPDNWGEIGSVDAESTEEVLKRVTVDWKHVNDANEQAIPFSAEKFSKLFAAIYAQKAIIDAYMHEVVPGIDSKN